MKLGYPNHGLRVTVRLHGTVVGQRVLWSPPVTQLLNMALLTVAASLFLSGLASREITLLGLWTPELSRLAIALLAPTGIVLALLALAWRRQFRLGLDGDDAVPTADGKALATITWNPGHMPVFVDHSDHDRAIVVDRDARWSWSSGDVDVDVAAQERENARRIPTDPLGDMGLVVVALTLYVGVMQAQSIFEMMPQPVAQDAQYEVTPELIARLLNKDLDGADEGIAPRVERPDSERKEGDAYMPAGTEGLVTRAGGGEVEGPRVVRRPKSDLEQLESPAERARRVRQGQHAGNGRFTQPPGCLGTPARARDATGYAGPHRAA